MISHPVALGLTLCDYVLTEEKTRRISLIGTFAHLSVVAIPGSAPPFSVFTIVTDALGSGKIDLILSRLDTGEEVRRYGGHFQSTDKLKNHRIHLRLTDCTFPAEGHFLFTLLVDGEWVAQRRFFVFLK